VHRKAKPISFPKPKGPPRCLQRADFSSLLTPAAFNTKVPALAGVSAYQSNDMGRAFLLAALAVCFHSVAGYDFLVMNR
jgi:hypothetical protein